MYQSSPVLREACAASIHSRAATLEADIAAACAEHLIDADWTPRSLAL
jgi:TetR/AcrR family transcriptional repressor of nem operon